MANSADSGQNVPRKTKNVDLNETAPMRSSLIRVYIISFYVSFSIFIF